MRKTILFLDFDGPLFSTRSLFLPENDAKLNSNIIQKLGLHKRFSYWKMDPIAVSFLNHLYHLSPYEIVVSSSWADPSVHEKTSIESLLKINKIAAPLHINWRTPRNNHWDRLYQIKSWLDNSPELVDDYLIIDDFSSANSLNKEDVMIDCGLFPDRVIIVNQDNGITLEDFKKMQKILSPSIEKDRQEKKNNTPH